MVSLRFEDLRSLESEPEVSLQFSTIAFKLLTQLRSALKKDQPSYIYIYIYIFGRIEPADYHCSMGGESTNQVCTFNLQWTQ